MAIAAILLLVVLAPGGPMESVTAEVSPRRPVRENGAPVPVAAIFRNASDRPIILVRMSARREDGPVTVEGFLGSEGRSGSAGARYHDFNLLAPREDLPLSLTGPVEPGTYRFELELEYLLADDGLLRAPVFAVARRDHLKRNPPSFATLEEYAERTWRRPIGQLNAVWRGRQQLAPAEAVLPYVLEVSATEDKQTQKRRASCVLVVEPDPDIRRLRLERPHVTVYRSGVPHFDLAFVEGEALFVREGGAYRRLGRVTLEAIAHVGSLLQAGRPVRVSVGEHATCLRTAFAERLAPAGASVGQAVVVGQGLPVIDLLQGELERLWECLARDDAALVRSQYYDYLVVERFPEWGRP